ncbi:MAG: DUF1987 domain-containing protein [Bacteroidetes bacterium]|nr:DUF1987 domain-containing protein [Bacteroidota bacterium]
MQKLVLEGTDNTPKVIFDPENNIFEISGSSHPENPAKFYNPLLNWIDEYAKAPNKVTELSFKLDYFNSSTAKYILNILWGFEKTAKEGVNKVIFHWYYQEEDVDAFASGERYAQLTTSEFRLVKH